MGGVESALVRGIGLGMKENTYLNPMARNLFILSALALLAGCSTPKLPPSASGIETTVITPTGTPVAPAVDDSKVTPGAVPVKKKLPLGTVRQK